MNNHAFVVVALESSGTWSAELLQFISLLGTLIRYVIHDSVKASYLFQHKPMALQWGNTICLSRTFHSPLSATKHNNINNNNTYCNNNSKIVFLYCNGSYLSCVQMKHGCYNNSYIIRT